MPYVTSFEQMAMEEGEARGLAKGLQEGIELAVKVKFGDRGMSVLSEISRINDLQTLRRVADSIPSAVTADDLRQAFNQ